MLKVASNFGMEPAGAGSQLPKTLSNMRISHSDFMNRYVPVLQTHLRGILNDPKNYKFEYRELFSAFFKIVCSGLMAPAVHCLTEVMNEFFTDVKRQLAACDVAILITALIQFNLHYGAAEKALQPPLRPIETLPGTTFPFSTANWFKAMRADHIFRNGILQNNIAAALRLMTLDALGNYDHENVRALVIMLWDAEKQYADCNPELFRKFVPALSARRPLFADPNPPQDPRMSFAWAVAEAKRLGIHDDDDFALGLPSTSSQVHSPSDDGMEVDDSMNVDDSDSKQSRRKRKLELISPPDEAANLSK